MDLVEGIFVKVDCVGMVVGVEICVLLLDMEVV